MPAGQCPGGHLGGSQGKPALVGGVTTRGHQVSVASREPPILSFKELQPNPAPETGCCGFGAKQCCGHMRRRSRVFQLFDCQLTMQPLGWFEFNILHRLREKFKDCSLQRRLVSFLPPGKWKHKAGSSSPCLSSPYKLQ